LLNKFWDDMNDKNKELIKGIRLTVGIAPKDSPAPGPEATQGPNIAQSVMA